MITSPHPTPTDRSCTVGKAAAAVSAAMADLARATAASGRPGISREVAVAVLSVLAAEPGVQIDMARVADIVSTYPGGELAGYRPEAA